MFVGWILLKIIILCCCYIFYYYSHSICSQDELYKIAEFLHLVPSEVDSTEKRDEVKTNMKREFLLDLLVSEYERRPNQLQVD